MDTWSILLFVIFVGPMFLIGDLANDLGRSPSRWIWIAAALGPLAIPLLYLVAATSALGKMIGAHSK